MHAAGGPRGVIDIHHLQYFPGLGVEIRPIQGGEMLSVNSCLGVLSLADGEVGKPRRPKLWRLNGDIRDARASGNDWFLVMRGVGI